MKFKRVMFAWVVVFAWSALGARASQACTPAQSQLDLDLLNTVSLGEPPTRPFDPHRFSDLLARGADVNARDHACQSVLLFAAISHAYLPDQHSDKAPLLEAIRTLVANGADVNAADKLGIVPLMMAVHRAHMGNLHHHQGVPAIKPVFDILLSATNPQADVNATNSAGTSIVGYLARWGEKDELQRFLSLGAKVDGLSGTGENLFQTLVGSGQGVDFIKWFVDATGTHSPKAVFEHANLAGSDSLITAVRAGDPEIVRYLLNDVSVESAAQNLGDETALSIALHRRRAPRTAAATRAKYLEIARLLTAAHASMPVVRGARDIRCDGPNGGNGRLAQLKAIIRVCRITHLDDLIPLLPKSHLSNYVLSYAPRGIQYGDFDFPRVITEGNDGQVLLSFNGKPGTSGYDHLELIEFSGSARARFVLHDIDFTGTRPHVSKANPKQCLTCHGGSDPKPVWDTWFIWPGFYQSEQAVLYPIEQAHYNDFIRDERYQGRYKSLLEGADSPLPIEGHEIDYINWEKMHRLDFIMEGLMGHKLATDVASQSRLKRFRFALLAALSCKDPIESFIPQKTLSRMEVKFDDIVADLKKRGTDELSRRISRQASVLPGSPEGGYASDFMNAPYAGGQNYDWDRVARLAFILENEGFTLPWSPVFEPDQPSSEVLRSLAWAEVRLWRDILNPAQAIDRPILREFSKRARQTAYWANYLPEPLFREPAGEGAPAADPGPVCSDLRQASFQVLSRDL